MAIERLGPSPAWERRARRRAAVLATAAALLSGLVAWALAPRVPLWVAIGLPVLTVGCAVLFATRSVRRRRRILREPFPRAWETILQRDVVFFRALDEGGRQRFRRELQIFLGEKRITGVGFALDETTRVLAGVSAIIPIFGFPEWEWAQIREILIYPERFDLDFAIGRGGDGNVLGMVGTGVLERMMVLSKPDLVTGFRNPSDRRNVGVHEFAHLVDKSDGTIDGLPGVGLEREAVGPWIELVRRKMLEIRRGDSDLDTYGLTNEAEFFAVASEYFFEAPGRMEREHPELYAMLARIFEQDLRTRATAMAKERRAGRGRKRFGRNSPCPCGSGRKYKKCCLRAARG